MGWNTETERQDDGRWIAEIAAVPGVIVYGKTEDEARRKACAPVTVAPVTSTIRGVPSEVVFAKPGATDLDLGGRPHEIL